MLGSVTMLSEQKKHRFSACGFRVFAQISRGLKVCHTVAQTSKLFFGSHLHLPFRDIRYSKAQCPRPQDRNYQPPFLSSRSIRTEATISSILWKTDCSGSSTDLSFVNSWPSSDARRVLDVDVGDFRGLAMWLSGVMLASMMWCRFGRPSSLPLPIQF